MVPLASYFLEYFKLIALSGFQRRPCYQVLQKLFIYRQYVEQLLLFPLWCGS
jgi:hypothetical protein